MKITKIIALIVAGAALLATATSCKNDTDFLEEHSYKFDDGSFYNSESDIEMGLAACYAEMQYLMYGNQHANHSWMIQGIGMDTFAPTGYSDQFGNWNNMNADNGYTRHWFDYEYNLINRCNTVIDMVDERGANIWGDDTDRANAYKAEAVFLRGWAYRFMAVYGRVPVLVHRTTEAVYNYEPSPRDSIWAQEKRDFEFAAQWLPTTPRLTGTVTKAAADAYLAEVCLALGEFDAAVTAAKKVIDGNDGDYHIMTTRFGNRADEATDRYGNSLAAPQGAYWDLFRGTWGRDASGKSVSKGDIVNQNHPDNKEAIWVCQYEFNKYEIGGGGDSWWRTHCTAMETSWSNYTYLGNQTTRTRKSDSQLFYVFGDNSACYTEAQSEAMKAAGISGTYSKIPGCEKRYVANFAVDSLGARVSYLGLICIPVEYVYNGGQYDGFAQGLFDDPNDFRGSEVMMQKNPFTPGGTRWKDEKAKMYKRAHDAQGTVDNDVCAVLASDTTAFYPRMWKFTDDCHPDGNNKAYDQNLYMLRVPEVYLLLAEAYLAKGDKSSAAAAINVVRQRAGAKDVTADKVNIDYILDERTRELLGEEHRLITLNRLSCNPHCTYISDCHPVQDESTANTAYDRVHKYGFGYENCSETAQTREAHVCEDGKTRHYAAFNPWNYQYPIPTQVIQSNSGYKYEQNYGYK